MTLGERGDALQKISSPGHTQIKRHHDLRHRFHDQTLGVIAQFDNINAQIISSGRSGPALCFVEVLTGP
jgi:hypothetical protein